MILVPWMISTAVLHLENYSRAFVAPSHGRPRSPRLASLASSHRALVRARRSIALIHRTASTIAFPSLRLCRIVHAASPLQQGQGVGYYKYEGDTSSIVTTMFRAVFGGIAVPSGSTAPSAPKPSSAGTFILRMPPRPMVDTTSSSPLHRGGNKGLFKNMKATGRPLALVSRISLSDSADVICK